MRLCDFLFYILLISFVRCFPASQPIRRPRGFLIVRLSPTSTRQDVTNAWRTVHNSAFKTPQVQIYLLKGHVSPDQNWAYSNEYKYSNQYYEEITAKKPSFTIDYKITKKPESGNRVDAEKNKGNPSLESRNIIDPPTHCPDGSAPDSNNVCRERLE